MDTRTAAHTLNRIADLLELHEQSRFKASAFRNAARAVAALDATDLRPALQDGSLAQVRGIGPVTLSVLTELAQAGESSYLQQLSEDTPEGLVEMLRIPGLGTAKIRAIHEGLDIDTVHELEEAVRDGRVARLPRFGPRMAEKIARGIAFLRETTPFVLYPRALAEARRLLSAVNAHPGVERAEIAGSIRRRNEIIRDVDIVAACRERPESVATAFVHAPGVRDAIGAGTRTVNIRYVDGTLLHLHCVEPDRFAVALWRATGSVEHEREMTARAAACGLTVADDRLLGPTGERVPVPDEPALYAALGLAYVEPELREGYGEVQAAAARSLPSLITTRDLQGVLHCHSQYSDGTSTIGEMAAAARARGWSYLGVSDHSQSALYAGGLSPETVMSQHEEIDRVNEELAGFRVLKGIEADILIDGRVDYESSMLDRFDYVIASVHSRFALDATAMTERVLRALDDPHVTILGHPTGRLLLTREPYAIDMEAVLSKAAAVGVAVELNADPHRLDLDWRLCLEAKRLGCSIEIGPDAHSTAGLDNVELGIGIARKGWLEPADVLNAMSADVVTARARRRRAA
ncbi:MAG TPA: PHP domain-containing protein [Gemmatimonadaceae bacterium]|nr:PHP domain-containing protein [Gemmatimonadaceae bacterium]